MKRPLPSPSPAEPVAEPVDTPLAERAIGALWPTTRRRFLTLVLAAGGLVATTRGTRRSAAAPATAKRPRWIGHC